ncbi:MAG TPA: hypothetical protein VFG99_00845, partial [Chloroflexia bacterium]|nr:hypothetical protein [Chloroflexia bacterium]
QRAGRLDGLRRRYSPVWTAEDEEYLLQHWGLRPDAEIARKLGRTVCACYLHAVRHGVVRKQNFYTATDVARIFAVDLKTVTRWIEHRWLKARKSVVRCGKNRCWKSSEYSIDRFMREHPNRYDPFRISGEEHPYWANRARRHLTLDSASDYRTRKFTPEQDACIIEQFGLMPIADLAGQLGWPAESVQTRAEKLRAKGYPVRDQRKSKHRRPRTATWTQEQDAFLEANWGLLPDAEVAARIGRTEGACEWRTYELAITRRDNRRRMRDMREAAS